MAYRVNHPEQRLQTQIAEWLDWVLPLPYTYTAIGHGGGGELRGKILRGMGVKAGWPDLVFTGPPARVWWIELKAGATPLSPAQVRVHNALRSAGHEVAVCRSLDAVRDQLVVWGIPLREAKPSGEIIKRGMAEALAQHPGTPRG